MGSIDKVFAQLKKDYGDGIIGSGEVIVDFERCAFGVFPLDLALGGGIPVGKMSMVYGVEASGKTMIALLLVKQFQQLYPEKQCVWVDAEWGFDPDWAARLGVDVQKLYVGKPETGEQAAEIVEGVIYADDIGLIVVDSIAGMVPHAEVMGDMARQQVGGNSMLVGKMVRKVVAGLITQAKIGVYPTLFFINQMRKKIGVMFGNPETYPGGHALRHYCNIIFRIYGKDIIIDSVSKKVPVMKEVTLGIQKYKVPIVSKTSKYQFAMIPHDGLKIGEFNSWNTIMAYAKDFGYIVKDGKGWFFAGEEYQTQKAIIELLEQHPEILHELQSKLIQEAVKFENKIE